MRHYQLARRTPMNELTLAEHGLLRLEQAMIEVRKTANEVRTRPWMTSRDMHYPVGFFNGVRFTIQMALDYWDNDYEDFKELAERYASEVEFLSGPYLDRRAA